LALRRGATGLGAGAAVSGVLLALLRLRVLPEDAFAEELLLAPPLIGLAVGIGLAYVQRIAPLDLARLAEQRLDLKERFSTAVALGSGMDADPLVRRQIADAEAHAAARAQDLPRALPIRADRRVWIALALSLVVGMAWFLPTLPVFLSAEKRAERETVQKEGERIVRVARAMERQAQAKKLTQTEAAAKKLAALGEQMQRGRLDKQKALMQAAKLSDEMRRQQQAAAAQNSPRSLAQAGKEMQKALAGAQAAPKNAATADAKNNLKAPDGGPKNSGGEGGKNNKQSGSQKALQNAAQAMQNDDQKSLAEQLSQLARLTEQGQPGDKAGRDQLSDQLSALSKALQGTSLEAASDPLQKAAEAMKRGDLAEASRQLQEAARKVQDAQRGREDAKSLEQMAEALQNGDGQQSADASAAMEGDVPSDEGEGQGEDDAFGKDGKKKDHDHKPGGT
jgi:hypothetical protein